MAILCTTDGSTRSLRALPHAARIASLTGEQLALLRILESKGPTPEACARELEDILDAANTDLAAADLNTSFLILDSDMHVSFVEALENRAISAVYARIMDNINLARQVHDRTAVRTRVIDSLHEHLAILDSLEKGDAHGAATNLEAHFRASAYRTIVAV